MVGDICDSDGAGVGYSVGASAGTGSGISAGAFGVKLVGEVDG